MYRYFMEIGERERKKEERIIRWNFTKLESMYYRVLFEEKSKKKRKLARQRQNFSGKTERRTKGALFKTKTK